MTATCFGCKTKQICANGCCDERAQSMGQTDEREHARKYSKSMMPLFRECRLLVFAMICTMMIFKRSNNLLLTTILISTPKIPQSYEPD